MQNTTHLARPVINVANPKRGQFLRTQTQPVGQGDDGFIPLSKARGTGYLQQTPDLTRI
jgi:hypothetical protein